MLKGEELGALAKRMVDAKNPAEADRLKEDRCAGILRQRTSCLKYFGKIFLKLCCDIFLTRMRQRNISHEQLILFARWLDTEPEVPDDKWFKKFSGMTVCGEGELIKTFLQPGQIATGEEFKLISSASHPRPIS